MTNNVLKVLSVILFLIIYALPAFSYDPVLLPIPEATILIDDGKPHVFNDNSYQSDWVYIDYVLSPISHPANDPGTHVNLLNSGLVDNLVAWNNATIGVNGGSVLDRLYAADKSHITIEAGNVGRNLIAWDSAEIDMSSGSIGHAVYAYHNSTISISGGTIGGNISALNNGTIYLDGTNFQANGIKLVNGDKLSNFGQLIVKPFGGDIYASIITGTLADGSTLDNEFQLFNTGLYEGTGDIIIIPEPCSLILLGLGGLYLRSRKA